MARENEFELEIGRIGRQERGFLQRVLHVSNLSGGGLRKSKFQGNRMGRGSGIGRVLSARDRYAAFRSRRVVSKVRVVKLAGKGLAAARAHLRYIQRDGVTREGEPGILYNADAERVDGKGFLDRGAGDRHQFRFIVSAEDAGEYQDLKPFIRRLMTQMEQDLGTKLDWVAVDHYNTGHPHTHVIVRGKDERNRDLIIAREYISHGIRVRAAEIVSFDLGPRTDFEIESKLKDEVGQDRFTSLDRRLLKEVGEDGLVRSGGGGGDNLFQPLRAGRLQQLKRLGLADEVKPGQWQLDPEMEPTLRRMGERGDIIHAMHRQMRERGVERSAGDYAIYDPADAAAKPLIGRVSAQGFADEINDRRYVILDALDGRAHYVEIGKVDPASPVLDGSIVEIVPKRPEARAVDRTIAEIAAANGGHYSLDIHLRHDPRASADFAETHVRRLEAMRRMSQAAEREADGSWIIAADHLDKAERHERNLARAAPVLVQTLSGLDLTPQVVAEGATWLDRELTAMTPAPARAMGFGAETMAALARRRQWLVEQDLARQEEGRTLYRRNLLAVLQGRELSRVGGQFAKQSGLDYAQTRRGERIEGVYSRRLELVSGSFALIESEREFQLVPWRPVLERSLGQQVSGIMRGDSVSWTIGRERGGPAR